MNLNRQIIICTIASVLFISCQETIDFYIGVPLQPEVDDNFTPGLNIFGVLRPDSTEGYNNSFIVVHEVAPAINNSPDFTPDSMIINDALVILITDSNKQVGFEYGNPDSVFNENRYRPTENISILAGSAYSITCDAKDLPGLTSTTIIPNQPIITEGSLKIEPNEMKFELKADTSIFMYEIHLFSGDLPVSISQITSDRYTPVSVNLNIATDSITHMKIFAYDNNLASYLLLSNTNLNFNIYREKFGNIENGYGVFGSLNFVLYNLN